MRYRNGRDIKNRKTHVVDGWIEKDEKCCSGPGRGLATDYMLLIASRDQFDVQTTARV